MRLPVAALVLLLTACGPAVPTPSSSPPAFSPAAPSPTVSKPLAAGGLLVSIKAEHQGDHDLLTFEFGGSVAPTCRINRIDQLHANPSDRIIPLQGTAFLELVFHGGTLDTSPRESDPSKVERYLGPSRLTPGLPLVKEVVVAGDFEAVLSFGVGLAETADFDVETLASPPRVVITLRRAK